MDLGELARNGRAIGQVDGKRGLAREGAHGGQRRGRDARHGDGSAASNRKRARVVGDRAINRQQLCLRGRSERGARHSQGQQGFVEVAFHKSSFAKRTRTTKNTVCPFPQREADKRQKPWSGGKLDLGVNRRKNTRSASQNQHLKNDEKTSRTEAHCLRSSIGSPWDCSCKRNKNFHEAHDI